MERTFQDAIVYKDLSQFSKSYIIPLGDFHIGSKFVAWDKIEGYIKWVAERDNAFIILGGDLMNCATKDTASELWEDLITPDSCYDKVIELIKPVQGKVLMVLRGNHEENIWRRVGHDYMAQLAKEIDAPYKPDGGMVAIKMKLAGHSSIFYIYGTHGWGGARTIGAKVRKVDDLAMGVEADCYILFHDHTQNVRRINVKVPPTGGNLRAGRANYFITSRRLLVNAGGFVDYGGYVQRKGYPPMDLGTPRIRLEIKIGGKRFIKDLHASI